MLKKRKKQKQIKILLAIICIALIIVLTYTAVYLRRTIVNYAQSRAQGIAFKIANNTINKILNDEKVSYNGIVNLRNNDNQNITALEIDIVKINSLKTEISSAIEDNLSSSDSFTVGIPIGTLFGNEYTLGLGTEVKFKMKLTATAVTDFESKFYAAGINQVLHQIAIRVKINGTLVLPWARSGFSCETTVIAAQTVIVGVVPDAFTNVDETTIENEPNATGAIFDYAAQVKE